MVAEPGSFHKYPGEIHQLFPSPSTGFCPLEWGAHLEGDMIQGKWLPQEQRLHVNLLEVRDWSPKPSKCTLSLQTPQIWSPPGWPIFGSQVHQSPMAVALMETLLRQTWSGNFVLDLGRLQLQAAWGLSGFHLVRPDFPRRQQ